MLEKGTHEQLLAGNSWYAKTWSWQEKNQVEQQAAAELEAELERDFDSSRLDTGQGHED